MGRERNGCARKQVFKPTRIGVGSPSWVRVRATPYESDAEVTRHVEDARSAGRCYDLGGTGDGRKALPEGRDAGVQLQGWHWARVPGQQALRKGSGQVRGYTPTA